MKVGESENGKVCAVRQLNDWPVKGRDEDGKRMTMPTSFYEDAVATQIILSG